MGDPMLKKPASGCCREQAFVFTVARISTVKPPMSFVFFPGRAKGVGHFAVSDGNSGVGYTGGNHKGHSGFKPVGFSIDSQFQYTFVYLDDLFVWMGMHRYRSTRSDFPHGNGHAFRMYKAAFVPGEKFLLRQLKVENWIHGLKFFVKKTKFPEVLQEVLFQSQNQVVV